MKQEKKEKGIKNCARKKIGEKIETENRVQIEHPKPTETKKKLYEYVLYAFETGTKNGTKIKIASQ